MTSSPRIASRSRLTRSEARCAAVEAGRQLLIERGPQAVTLKAVAERIGRTHASLLHHFGSAVRLQEALIAQMTKQSTEDIRQDIFEHTPASQTSPNVVDLTFAAFAQGGGSALAGWMIISGNADALDPLFEAIANLVHVAAERQVCDKSIRRKALALSLLALGDALFGGPLAEQLDVPRGDMREIARMLLALDENGVPAHRIVSRQRTECPR